MTPREELERRINKLQEVMQAKGIGGALLLQRADLFYFSGTGQNAHLIIPAVSEPTLVVKKSITRARQESSLENIVPYTGREDLTGILKESIPAKSTIGLETDVLPANLYFRYQQILDGYNLTDISGPIREIRAIKSPYELEQMKRAAGIGKSVFEHARRIIREGMLEVELAGRLEYHARTMGHQGTVRMRGFNQELFYGHIMSGENASVVTFFDGPTGGSGLNPSFPQGAGAAAIGSGEPILVDFVSVLGGYMVDQTRVFCLDDLPLHLQEAYRQAVLIRNTLAEMGAPGVTAGDLYNKAEEMANDAGLGNHFMGYVEKVNFIGHGVGLELDELPVIAQGADYPLEEGMVFALEPKFVFPGEGTVGIEDTFVVGCNRLEQLTEFSDALQIL